MPGVHRLGDLNEHGGAITDIPQGTVFANDVLVSVDGSNINNSDTTTANGNPTVFINGIPVNTQGNEDEDGSTRAEGSGTVFVGP